MRWVKPWVKHWAVFNTTFLVSKDNKMYKMPFYHIISWAQKKNIHVNMLSFCMSFSTCCWWVFTSLHVTCLWMEMPSGGVYICICVYTRVQLLQQLLLWPSVHSLIYVWPKYSFYFPQRKTTNAAAPFQIEEVRKGSARKKKILPTD